MCNARPSGRCPAYRLDLPWGQILPCGGARPLRAAFRFARARSGCVPSAAQCSGVPGTRLNSPTRGISPSRNSRNPASVSKPPSAGISTSESSSSSRMRVAPSSSISSDSAAGGPTVSSCSSRDRTDHLFQHVLHGDQADDRAELIHHHRHVRPAGAELLEHLRERLGLGHDDVRPHQAAHAERPARTAGADRACGGPPRPGSRSL